MGKKKVEEMVKERLKFQAGAAKNGLTDEQGAAIFDNMEKFAGYGFNKSHAAAYAVVAYRSAYLKANYPVEFYTALVNNYASDTTKHKKLPDTIANARAVGIRILPPDINTPNSHFTATIEGIRYGMSGLKGVNSNAVEVIIAARKEGPFVDLVDFCRRTSGTPHVNKRVIDALVKVGAFDSIDSNRAELFANVDTINKYAGKLAKRENKAAAVLAQDMFADLPPVAGEEPLAARRKPRKVAEPKPLDVPELIKVTPWNILERVQAEHAVAGFYISGHPFDAMADQYAGLQAATPLAAFEKLDPEQETGLRLLTAVVDSVYKAPQRNGGNYGRISLSDGDSSQSVMAFADAFGPHEEWIVPGAHFAAAVRIEKDNRAGETGNNIKVDHIISPARLQELLLEKVHLAIPADQMDTLENVLAPHVHVNLADGSNAAPTIPVRLHMPDSQNPGNFLAGDLAGQPVKPSAALISDLQAAFGADCVKPAFRRQLVLQETPRPKRQNNRSNRPR
jgi:DNA polymerase-3 subunit alpha